MSYSKDPDHFFQTDASESTRARKAAKASNKNGDPIVLQSKLLGAVRDPTSSKHIFVAESAGNVRRVDLELRDSSTIYKGPTAPLTSVAVGARSGTQIFAGCWDKTVWSWDIVSRTLVRQYKGHSDFVKIVVCGRLGEKDVLISGGADAKIIVWDIATGARLHTIRDKRDTMMAVQDLAIDYHDSSKSEIILISASSDPHIRRWRITEAEASQVFEHTSVDGKDSMSRETILEHETSVYNLLFCEDDEDGDLWTASADGTAKCLSRVKGWTSEDTYNHGDYVRAVTVTSDWVVTAGRDEDIKVWDKASGKLWHTYEGHFEEVTRLVLFEEQNKVISISIDGTVRTWSLDRTSLKKAKEDQLTKPPLETEAVDAKGTLTAEEEAELAELMDSDDD